MLASSSKFVSSAEPLQQAGDHPHPGAAVQPLHHAGHHQARRRIRRQPAARQIDTPTHRPQPCEFFFFFLSFFPELYFNIGVFP